MMQYKEIDMYDTVIKTYGKSYGDHVLGLEPNSKGIMVVKCVKCHIARFFLIGQDQTSCNAN